MEKQPKIYVGNGKENQYGVRISLCVSDIPKEYIKEGKNGKKYLNLNLDKRREPDKFGNSHSLSINTWQKEEKTEAMPF